MDVNVKIPRQFQWVIDFIYRWWEENKDGEIRLIFKSGGITGLNEKTEKYHSPPC